jgi:plastocyanin
MNLSLSTKRSGLSAAGAVLVLVMVATGCGSSSKASTAGAAASTMPSSMMPSSTAGSAAATGGMTIDIKNFSFMPMSATVPVGTKVTWKFEDSTAHTVKADDGSYTSPALSSGQTFSHVFTKAGTYSYICSIHQYMHGTIVVK